MPFTIIRQDITKMHVDVIVNAANTSLAMGGGVCGAIFKAAGAKEMQEACSKVAPIKTGEAVITPAFNLPAKYVIHTAGPIYHNYEANKSAQLLLSAYTESLKLALQYDCKSIAFPLISSGIYAFPKDEALNTAVFAIKCFLANHDMDVYLVIFDRDSFCISKFLLGKVESYIDENYVDSHYRPRRRQISEEYGDNKMFCRESLYPSVGSYTPKISKPKKAAPQGLDSLIGKLDEPFNATLLKLIEAKGKTDAEVYKKANIDRKLFSKIRTGKGYMPSKRTILALAVALELNLRETDDLLKRAGYAISHSQKFDVIVEYFIVSEQYDIFEINQVLFQYDQPLLGGG